MIGFIGFGRMGGALAKGAVSSGVLKPSQIVGYDHNPRARAALKKLGGRLATNAADVVAKADFVFLCVKPQGMRDALTPISLESARLSLKRKCFVSIAAGIPIERFQSWLGDGVSIFRVMPNTPAMLSAGMSAVSRGKYGTAAQQKKITAILSSVGEVSAVPESLMDAITALSGSGPAYVFYLAEAMIEGARSLGMKAELAKRFVHQTIYGAGVMLARRPEPADELRRQVTSPGGTTAAAMQVFDMKDLKRTIQEAVQNAARRSAQLAKS